VSCKRAESAYASLLACWTLIFCSVFVLTLHALRTLQLWHARALFDVGRAELANEMRARQRSTASADSSSTTNSTTAAATTAASGTSSRKQPVDSNEDGSSTIAPNLYVRCNFCNMSLPLR
jgi:hypothetical protein